MSKLFDKGKYLELNRLITDDGLDKNALSFFVGKVLKEIGNPKIDAIPNSYEKFMSFNIGSLRFIDSLQFMASSLEK